MGAALAALAVLAAFLAIWAATSIGDRLRSPAPNASVTQSSGGQLGIGALEQP
jgi:hypothetical protein